MSTPTGNPHSYSHHPPWRAAPSHRLTLRQRRALARIERRFDAEDPALSEALRGPVDHGAVIGRWLGLTMLWLGIVVLAVGTLTTAGSLIAGGCVLLLTFWLPMRFRTEP